MLDKLRTLETLIISMNKQYHVVATELANLKNKPNNEAKYEATIDELTVALNTAKDAIAKLQGDLKNSQSRLNDSERQAEQLAKENRQLLDENTELKQKNRLAIERAELIQTWLYNIDNAKNSQ